MLSRSPKYLTFYLEVGLFRERKARAEQPFSPSPPAPMQPYTCAVVTRGALPSTATSRACGKGSAVNYLCQSSPRTIASPPEFPCHWAGREPLPSLGMFRSGADC